MRLSVRTRILAIYGILSIAFLFAILAGLSRLNRIGSRLSVIEGGYLLIVKTINASSNFYHLDETFDVEKILANRGNRLFVNAITMANPKLLENGLERGIADAQKALKKSPSPKEERSLERISQLIHELVTQHRTYAQMIQNVWVDIQRGNISKARSQADAMQAQKRLVRSRIDFLARRLDDQIRDGIRATVEEERKAVYLSLGLSVGTLLLALLFGLWAILSLKPLRQLQNAAREIAAGDLRQRVRIKTMDEVGELAREFNRMADSIEQRDEALRRQQDQLIVSEKMAVIGRMASKISHEVRNPLNALSLNVEMLDEDVHGTEAKKTLNAIASEIDRLNQIAESYLTLARSPVKSTSETDLNQILNHLGQLIGRECSSRNLHFEIQTPESLPKVKADPVRIEQALLNLVRNAMEAVGSDGKLGIRAIRENGMIHLSIWDCGSGISKDEISMVFEPFYTTKDKGTGLGLAITSEIIRDHGGTIECESQQGQGTIFHVRIPFGS